jgi:phosphate transport system permease protein
MSSIDIPTGTISLSDLRGSVARRRKERTIKSLLFGAAAFSVVISALIVVTLIFRAIEFLDEVPLGDLFTEGWFPRRDMFDVRTLFVGSLIVTGIAMLVATPLGLGAAIYLSEYASPRVRKILKPVLEVLSGIPSVVVGLFAITWISPNLVQSLRPDAPIQSLAAAGLGVAVLTIPLIASVSEDAMRAVPNSLREASYGIGARKMATTIRVVVPAAVSGLVAAFIVAFSRAIGETMVVAIAAGGSGGTLFGTDPFEPGLTLTAAMASLAKGTDQVAGSGSAFKSLFFVGFLLFCVTLLLNTIANRFVQRVRQKY